VAVDMATQATIYKDALTYIHGNFETDNPSELNKQTFSLVTCKLVYAFIHDKPAFLEKVNSLLSDEGTFVMITPVYEKEEEPSPIGVERTQTIATLEGQFSRVEQIDLEWAMCFVCRK
jgi:2-polyprenyl-3-methyl-5-hydroxy-6-metoxy-1,4-benzoquinol methylase